MPALTPPFRFVLSLMVAAVVSFGVLFLTPVLAYVVYWATTHQRGVEFPGGVREAVTAISTLTSVAAGPLAGSYVVRVPSRRACAAAIAGSFTLVVILSLYPWPASTVPALVGAFGGLCIALVAVALEVPWFVFRPGDHVAHLRTEPDRKAPSKPSAQPDIAGIPFMAYVNKHPVLQGLVALATTALFVGLVISCWVPSASHPILAQGLTCRVLYYRGGGSKQIWEYVSCSWSEIIWALEGGFLFGVFPTIIVWATARRFG